GPYLVALHADTERRPIAEQIVDQLLAEDEARYKVYEEVRASRQAVAGYGSLEERLVEPDLHEAIGFFLAQWIALERIVRERSPREADRRSPMVPSGSVLERLGVLNANGRVEFDRIRRLRNNLVHGVEVPDATEIREAAERLRQIVASFGPVPE